MKILFAAMALAVAFPAAAQPAADPHSGHAEHKSGHEGHQGHHDKGKDCCKDGKPMDCCKKAGKDGKAMACCAKHEGAGAKPDHKGH